MVNLADTDGQIISVSAARLLGLQEGAVVMVSGQPQRVDDLPMIDTKGLRILSTDAKAPLSPMLCKSSQ